MARNLTKITPKAMEYMHHTKNSIRYSSTPRKVWTEVDHASDITKRGIIVAVKSVMDQIISRISHEKMQPSSSSTIKRYNPHGVGGGGIGGSNGGAGGTAKAQLYGVMHGDGGGRDGDGVSPPCTGNRGEKTNAMVKERQIVKNVAYTIAHAVPRIASMSSLIRLPHIKSHASHANQ